MNDFDMIEFYNPIKQRPVMIRRGAIQGADYDGANKVNIVYVNGGMFPVQETLDEIKQKVQLNSPVGQERKRNGNNTTERTDNVRPAGDVRKRKTSKG